MNRKTFWILLGILIIAIFLRTYHLKTTPPGLYPDEAMNGSNALEALRTHHFKVFYPENNGREGLFMNVQAIFVATLGREPWVLRLPSTIFGTLTVLGLFFFTRELFWRRKRDERGMLYADRVALLSAFLLATNFWHINFSRIGFRAITSPFFLIWALYFFLAALRDPGEGTHARRYAVSAILVGIFFGLGFYSYIAYRAMPLLFLLFIPFFRNRKNFWKITGIFITATFIVAAPIGWYFLKHPADFLGRTTQVSVTAAPHPIRDLSLNIMKTIGMLDIKGDSNWRHNLPGQPELFWPVGIFFWIGVFLAFKKENRKDRLPFLVLFGWLALAMLPVVVSNEGIPHALRSILMIPPLFAIAGIGGIWLYDLLVRHMHHRGQRTAVRAAALLFFALLTLNASYTYFILWARDPNTAGAFNADYVAIADEIRALPQATPKYVVVQAGGGTVALRDPFGADQSAEHNVPIPAQTVMFLTDSFSPERQLERNIHYVVPGDTAVIPDGAQVFYIK